MTKYECSDVARKHVRGKKTAYILSESKSKSIITSFCVIKMYGLQRMVKTILGFALVSCPQQ